MTEANTAHYSRADAIRIACDAAAKTAIRHRVSVADIFATSRGPRDIANARMEAMAACRAAGLSYPDIGAQFGRHHATAMHAVKAFEKRKEGKPA